MTARISYIKNSCFEARFTFEGSQEKRGVRCHSKVTAMIMKLFGMATEKATVMHNGKEKIIYINKKSLLNWCKKHEIDLGTPSNVWETLIQRAVQETKSNQQEVKPNENLDTLKQPLESNTPKITGTFDEKLSLLKMSTKGLREEWLKINFNQFKIKLEQNGIPISNEGLKKLEKAFESIKIQDILVEDQSILIMELIAEMFDSEEGHEQKIDAIHHRLFGKTPDTNTHIKI